LALARRPSGPIALIEKVKATLDYAVSVVNRKKLMLGTPQYAYDWTIKEKKQSGKAYSTQHAIIYILAIKVLSIMMKRQLHRGSVM
jgi:spore germination protein YaaH